MDIRLVRKQLQVEFANLNSADFDSAEIAANDFFDFLYNTELIREIVETLPENKIDIEEWTNNLQSTQLSLPRDKRERISFLIAVLDKYKDDLLIIAHQLYAGTNHHIDHIRKYFDVMVKPIYQYFDNELHIKELDVSPVSPVSITNNNSITINGDNYGPIAQANIEIVQGLTELSEAIQKSSELSNEQKLEAINNIDTIKSQAVSPKPNKQIIKLAWQTIVAMADIAGATDLVLKVTHLIGGFIS